MDSQRLALYVTRKDGGIKQSTHEEKPRTGDADVSYALEGVKGRPFYHTVP